MKYNPDIHHRQSIRLKEFDYSQNEAYFVTICTWQRNSMLGEIVYKKIELNAYGEAVEQTWLDLPNHINGIILDCFIVMPDHFHGIVVLSNDTAELTHKANLPEVVRQFKTFSARRINCLRETSNVPVWQRNYYERIIRNHEELLEIQQYILYNPSVQEQNGNSPGVVDNWK